MPTAVTGPQGDNDGVYHDSIVKDIEIDDQDDDHQDNVKSRELGEEFDLQNHDSIELPNDQSTGDMFENEEKPNDNGKDQFVDTSAIKLRDTPEKQNAEVTKGDDSGDSISADALVEPKADVDPLVKEQQELIKSTAPSTVLEIALSEELGRKQLHVDRLSNEVMKLKAFISKRKQTYKRKRKDEGAPTRALSAYNIFVQDRFSRLAKENEAALKSADSDAQLKRVPPASLVASTGNQWKELSAEEKHYYEERAKTDRKRYEDQMAKYHPPDKQANRKRNKTGYNMFFSAHVLQLKRSESGVPSERGSVARLVGNAWKELSPEDKQYYEREADKQNGMASDEEGDEKEDEKRRSDYPPGPGMVGMDPGHRPGMPPPMGHGPPVVHQPPHHDPRLHQYPPPGPPASHYQYPPYYEYHQPPPQGQNQSRSQSSRGHNGYYHPSHYPAYHDHQGSGL